MIFKPVDPAGRDMNELRASVRSREGALAMATYAVALEYNETGVMTRERMKEIRDEFMRLGVEVERANGTLHLFWEPPLVFAQLRHDIAQGGFEALRWTDEERQVWRDGREQRLARMGEQA